MATLRRLTRAVVLCALVMAGTTIAHIVCPAMTVNYRPAEGRPQVYILSVSIASYPDGDVWLLEYSLDGAVQSATLPLTRDPQGYLDYLACIGEIVGPGK